MNLFKKYFVELFVPKASLPPDDFFLRGMMLFNLFFFLQQFQIYPYYFIGLRIVVAILFLRYITLKWISFKSHYVKLMLFILLIWSLYMCRNITESNALFAHAFFQGFNVVCLIMPFCITYFAKIEHLPKYINFSIRTVRFAMFLTIIFLPHMLINWQDNPEKQAESMQLFEVINLYIGGGLLFCVLFINKLKAKDKSALLWGFILFAFLGAYFDRRAITLSYIIGFMFMFYFGFLTIERNRKLDTFLKYIFLIFIISIFLYSFGDVLFNRIIERATKDTRSTVEIEMLSQLVESGEVQTGRGISGSYSSELFSENRIERSGIETGYLNLILKGGVIYLVILCLLILPAIMLGIFASRNTYMKILASFNLIFILCFCTASSNMTFSIRYFLFLTSTYILYTKTYRKMSNKKIEIFLGKI